VTYDVVLCVGPQHRLIALQAIRALVLFLPLRTLYVVTARAHFEQIRAHFPDLHSLTLVDENTLIPGVTLGTVQACLQQRTGSSRRAGWYFQQFLKMGLAHLDQVADHYLIWDADSLLLQPLAFFDADGAVLVNRKKECHAPYFDLIRQLLGLERQVDYSFISEHLMVDTAGMRELLTTLEAASAGRGWVAHILGAIDDAQLPHAGFSEFETYGNFMVARHPERIRSRVLKSTRHGTRYYGNRPGVAVLCRLMSGGYAFASFEVWQRAVGLRVGFNRAVAALVWAACSVRAWGSERHRRQVDAARLIGRG